MFCNATTSTDQANLTSNTLTQADWLVEVHQLNQFFVDQSENSTVGPSHSEGEVWTFDHQ